MHFTRSQSLRSPASCSRTRILRRTVALLALLFGSAHATAQTSFSIDYRSVTKGGPDCGGALITEGDILVPATGTGFPVPGPVPAPCIAIPAPGLGLAPALHAACLGLPPGTPCAIEVDALSYGFDAPAMPGMPPGSFWFSVDSFSGGVAAPIPPNVLSEGVVGGMEASADVFADVGIPPGAPVCPGAVPPGNIALIDGDGLPGLSAFAYPGLGLIEPNAPICPPAAHAGDNLDAVDVDGPLLPDVYFSLDGALPTLPPVCVAVTTGSAAAAGFLPGDVLISFGGAAPLVYAPAAALGLDMAGVGTDDLDAVAVFNNGAPGVYVPSVVAYDWLGGATDMVLFSVTAGSAVIGMPDSACGAPIEPGDILTTPLPLAMGGVSLFPAIFISAETLGLLTVRTHGGLHGDEMDALDVVRMPIFSDCDMNGVEDVIDIGLGASDCNSNGVIDSCECGIVITYCTGKTTSQGCIPFLDSAGAGLPSITDTDPFNVRGNDFTPGNGGILIYGYKKANLSFHGGKLCVKIPTRTSGKTAKSKTPIACVGPLTIGRLTTNFNNRIQGGFDPLLTCGQKVFVQWQQRDSANTIGGFGDALSNGMNFVICP